MSLFVVQNIDVMWGFFSLPDFLKYSTFTKNFNPSMQNYQC